VVWESRKKKRREAREKKVRTAMAGYASRKTVKDRELRRQHHIAKRMPKDVMKDSFANVTWGRIHPKKKRG